MRKRYSLNKIESQEKSPFDEGEYSLFKFGDTYFARKFAKQLFVGFIAEFKSEILKQEEIILFPSPYYSIPTASNFLCHYFKEELNYFLFEHGRAACIEGKIYRQQTYVEDYGNMNYEERINLISNDTYYIDKHFVDGKFCIFLDDIKITGSHENTVDRILKEYEVKGEFIFVYFAELMNTNIHPKIENHYNYFKVKTTEDLVEVINGRDFHFNTRITKFILLMKVSEFEHLYDNIAEKRRNEILSLAISNNYHQVEEYKKNITTLKNKIKWQSTYKKDKDKTLMHQNLPSD
ncbi:phosphoribosyltransferase family protein [Kaistella sp.]|uniref:phosphoribosyltransferase family protein n=1 Tax=Kaistella sp. TaxID=2782235 RepID=UPI0035A05611